MEWKTLSTEDQLTDIEQASFRKPQVIFKHSTRCSISSMALSRLERSGSEGMHADFYYLDLLAHRNVSNAVAHHFKVQHQSPQIIVVKEGKPVYNESHLAIEMDSISDHL